MMENTYIKPSSIHGLGLFAKIDILKGEEIIQGKIDWSFYNEWIEYKKTNKTRSFAFHNGYCLINHCENANVKRGKKMEIIAKRKIMKGEEITEDYYALPEKENPFLVFNLEKLIFESQNVKTNKRNTNFKGQRR